MLRDYLRMNKNVNYRGSLHMMQQPINVAVLFIRVTLGRSLVIHLFSESWA